MSTKLKRKRRAQKKQIRPKLNLDHLDKTASQARHFRPLLGKASDKNTLMTLKDTEICLSLPSLLPAKPFLGTSLENTRPGLMKMTQR